jgi:hypothetical protein
MRWMPVHATSTRARIFARERVCADFDEFAAGASAFPPNAGILWGFGLAACTARYTDRGQLSESFTCQVGRFPASVRRGLAASASAGYLSSTKLPCADNAGQPTSATAVPKCRTTSVRGTVGYIQVSECLASEIVAVAPHDRRVSQLSRPVKPYYAGGMSS